MSDHEKVRFLYWLFWQVPIFLLAAVGGFVGVAVAMGHNPWRLWKEGRRKSKEGRRK